MNKKKIAGIALLALWGMTAGYTVAATPAGSDFGLGFVLGNPSGLSAKLPAGNANAFQFILAYDQGRNWGNRGWGDNDCGPGPGNDNVCDGRLYFGGDYVWYKYDLIHVSQGRLPFYYGPGAWVSVADNTGMGIRFALGLEYQFATAPFDIFLEIAPGIRVIPNTNGYVSTGLGGRFFF